MAKKDWREIIFTAFLIIIGIIIIYQIIRFLLGGSWSFESIIIALLVFNLGWTFKINSKLDRHLGTHEGYDKAKESSK